MATASRSVLTTTSAGDFICWKRAFLKKSELNSTRSVAVMSKFESLKTPAQGVDRLRIARRFERPRGHLRLVGDEEIVQVPADKASAGRLLYDDIDDVFAV